MCESRHTFPNYASALARVPKEHREFWSEAKLEVPTARATPWWARRWQAVRHSASCDRL